MATNWHDKEVLYLKQLHDVCVRLSKEYMTVYQTTKKLQTKLRLPAIFLSSCTGVASFGSTSFPTSMQRYVSIAVGIVNIGIALIQTYESYLKIADIVSTSLSASVALKKLGDQIYCEVFIPAEDRNTDGITFLRDCFHQYQAIIEQAPPIEKSNTKTEGTELTNHVKNDKTYKERQLFGKTFLPTISEMQRDSGKRNRLSQYISSRRLITLESEIMPNGSQGPERSGPNTPITEYAPPNNSSLHVLIEHPSQEMPPKEDPSPTPVV